MALGLDLAELSRHLRQERLFVTSEREQLQTLYEQVKTSAEQLYHQSWISRQQKGLLDVLIGSSRQVTPSDCCARTNLLEGTLFVDGYKHLSYHDSKYGEFLKFLLDNPSLIGQILCIGEKNNIPNLHEVIKTLMHSVYGNCVLQEDETLMLQILKTLLDVQVATCDNPRRMLRRGSCAFSVTFKQLFDIVFSAKLFLTAALHDPVMRLLMEDEWFYDIDPGKALVRFPPTERLKRFGDPGTDQYKEKLIKYRTTIVDKLVLMANRFISSIKNNMHCFPPSLAWMVSQMYQTLTKAGKVSTEEVRAVCADLVFALFICPAICDPEPYGITTDVPISHIARHNLMQMAQIIQVLAISQWDEIDPKLHDLYGKFEKGCMSSLLDSLLDGMGLDLPASGATQLPCLARTSSLIQLSQLNTLVSFLRGCVPCMDESSDKKYVEELLSGLVSVSSPASTTQGTSLLSLSPAQSASTPPGTPATGKKYKGKKKMSVASVMSQVSQNSDETGSVSSINLGAESESQPTNQIEEVLVISLGNDMECPGMMSEQKVLSTEQDNKRRRVKYEVPGEYVGPVEIQEKRTRFSLSHDQESIGNTSDIPEAISEGASSHSVGSQDLENDDDNDDNFSDMISANVSGRGTPNISGSGRDTPLSQAGSVEQMERERVPHPQPALPDTVQKKNREDVTDKFGKFDIKHELDYDLKSTVSDTWSTDVLASDSEPPDMSQQVRLEEIAEEMARQNLLHTQEISETASDAWSTDVLASDTDEKQTETFSEFDDVSSVAGGNLDDVRSEADASEAPDGQEVTPLASGFQSPNEGVVSDLFPPTESGGRSQGVVSDMFPPTGAVGRGQGGASVTSDNVSMSPTFSDSVFSDIDEGSRAPRDLTRGNRRSSGNLPMSSQLGSASPIVHSSANIPLLPMDANKLFVPIKKKGTQSPPGTSPDRGSETGTYGSSSSTRNRLVDFDLEPRYETRPSSEPADSLLGNNVNDSHKETGARPKTSPMSINSNNQSGSKKDRRNLDRNKFKDNYSREINNRKFDKDSECRPISNDSGIRSIELSEDVQISEQQSTNVDEARFSAALSLFDPLSQESDLASGDLLEGAGSPTSRSPFTSFSNPNYDDSTGKAFLALNKDKGTRELSNFVMTEPGKPAQANGPSGVEGGGMYLTTADGQPKVRRSSSDSNHSSASSLSKDGTGDRGADNSVPVADNKEMANGDENVTPGKKRGLFRTFKEKIHKGIKKKGQKQEKDGSSHDLSASVAESGSQGDLAGKVTTGIAEPNIIITETSDDILAKYRKKSILTSTPTTDSASTDRDRRLTLKQADDMRPLYDPSNLENCLAFLDAKRKLRIVLSSADFQQVGYSLLCQVGSSYSPRESGAGGSGSGPRDSNDLVNLLRTQLSEAINLQNKDTIAQLHEALRCVRQFDNDGCKKLVASLQEDYRNRSSYVSYLVRCKQGLLNTQSHLTRLQNRIKREKEIYNKHMTSVCVRLFLEKWEKSIQFFIQDFQKLTVSDEKTDLLEKFLQFLDQKLNIDVIWQAASESQLDDARLSIERFMMSRIYTHAMFPNSDGDILRDQILQQHMKELSKVITPEHKDLKIPKMYHLECPWPAAQRELYMINAYKTPRDKVMCVQRCAATIMNLLSMANEKSVPAADDFTPVFIFVIIKANPPCLLSTIQYINSFYQDRLQGEEQYWWIQFVGAVEFIKTMDYGSDSQA